MYRRKVTAAAAAVFAFGVAFAAEPTSDHANRNDPSYQQRSPWVPGKNMLMSAHEASAVILAPPPP
jgi:hypothetical protein